MHPDFRKFAVFFLLGLTSLSALNLSNLKTEELNLIYYSQAHAYLVPHLVRAYTNTMAFDRDFWDWEPSEPITIFVDDFSDWGNGGATAVPRNFVYVSLSPYMYVFEVAPAIDRISLLMHHELTHVIMMDKASPGEKHLRAILGGKIRENRDHPVSIFYAYLTTPRKFSPRWYHEGMAVFMETWLSGGIGRALGSYDEMVFRSLVKDAVPLYHAIGLEAEGTAIDFQVGANSYLYGTRFFNYLAYTYSPEKLKAWINRTPDSRKYYTNSFRHVFDVPLNEAWNDWIRFERNWQEENLKLIGANPLTNFRPITDASLGSVSRSFYDPERHILYSAVKFPGQIAQLLTIDTKTGKTAKLCHIRGASTYFTSSLAWDQKGDKMFFTTDNFTYRDLNMIDLKNNKVKPLINNLRAGDLAFDRVSSCLWAIRHENGISTLIRIPPPYTEWQAVHAFPFGTDIYDLDISPDGRNLSAALTHLSGEQELVIFSVSDLETGIIEYNSVFDFDYSSPANFVFSEDGRFLYGTSYYTGVSNVFKYDLENGDISVISNCETGFFRPVPVSNDSLLVFRYTGGKGFIPGWIPDRAVENVNAINYLGQQVNEKHPVVREWYYGVTSNYAIDSLIVYKGRYSSLANFHNTAAYPVIEGFQDRISLGYYLEYTNDIGYDKIDLTVGYEPFTDSLSVEDKLHARLNYQYRNWGFHFTYNRASFYDLFGPTKIARRGYSLGIDYLRSLIYDKPRFMDLTFALTAYSEQDILPEYQNVASDYSEMLQGKIGLTYKYLQGSLGAVDDEKGYNLGIHYEARYLDRKYFQRIHAVCDYGLPLPVNHSSLWLRTTQGWAEGEQSDSFNKFYFGGFGNNWVDYQNEKRYREYHSFPGAELNELAGLTFQKSMLELNLPPLRFRQAGFPEIYLRWLRPAIFASVLTTDPLNPDFRDVHYNAGIQIDFEIILLAQIKSVFSLGYALYLSPDNQESREYMISLKLL